MMLGCRGWRCESACEYFAGIIDGWIFDLKFVGAGDRDGREGEGAEWEEAFEGLEVIDAMNQLRCLGLLRRWWVFGR